MVFLGLLAAAFAAAVTLMFAETAGLTRPIDVSEAEAKNALLVNVLVIAGYAFATGFVPAFFAGLFAEFFRWRTILYFAVAGAAIGGYLLFAPMPGWINVVQEGEPLIRDASKAYPAAGIVAGAMYWLITGCKVGFRRDIVAQTVSNK